MTLKMGANYGMITMIATPFLDIRKEKEEWREERTIKEEY